MEEKLKRKENCERTQNSIKTRKVREVSEVEKSVK